MRAPMLPLALALALVSRTAVVGAQPGAIRGWSLSRFEPAPAGDAFVVAEFPRYGRRPGVAAGLVYDHAFAPLTLRREYATGVTRDDRIVAAMGTLHLVAAAAFFDRLGIHLSAPLSLVQVGSVDPTMATRLGPADGPSPGDLRLGARVRLGGHSDRAPISVHLGAVLWVPTGNPEANTGDGAARGELRALLAGRISLLRWAFGTSFTFRKDFDAGNILVGDELGFTAALGLALLHDRLNLGLETALRTTVRGLPMAMGGGSAAFTRDALGGEVLASVRYALADTVALGLGGGFGYGEAPGVPAGRLVFTAQYAPLNRARPAR